MELLLVLVLVILVCGGSFVNRGPEPLGWSPLNILLTTLMIVVVVMLVRGFVA